MPTHRFEVLHRDAHSHARLGRLHTPHGVVETPLFMPVGTRASVKGLLPEQLRRAGADMLLANTYHLALRPGAEVVAAIGGLHKFMSWDGPILTDSGGYQVFSLAQLNHIDDDGVTFKSHVDGAVLRLDPESAVRLQEQLGADVIMAFDQCPALPAPPAAIDEAVDRTIRWARRCKAAQTRGDQALFGINQGGLDVDRRLRCMDALVKIGFPGYAVGGLSVGEDPCETARALAAFVWRMPEVCPRYLMGVGRPIDIARAVACGVDMFDCVLPTRNGRNAFAFVDGGYLRLRNAKYKCDERPLLDGCDCYACAHFSRAYLRHLFLAGEMLGPILVSLHNIAYYQRWMRRIRHAILQNRLSALLAESEQAAARSTDSEDTPC
jgi:queuine tRNA-ribosyltransferase